MSVFSSIDGNTLRNIGNTSGGALGVPNTSTVFKQRSGCGLGIVVELLAVTVPADESVTVTAYIETSDSATGPFEPLRDYAECPYVKELVNTLREDALTAVEPQFVIDVKYLADLKEFIRLVYTVEGTAGVTWTGSARITSLIETPNCGGSPYRREG